MPPSKRNQAFPYLTVGSTDCVTTTDWTWTGPPGTGIDGNVVRGWDPVVHFSLSRTVSVDVGKLADELQLEGQKPAIECVVTATTAGRKIRWIATRVPLDYDSPGGALDIRAEFDSSKLAESLSLTTGLYLTSGRQNAKLLSPTKVGSRLWEETINLVLEGSSPRPTMRVHSFSESYRHEGMDKARYFIEIHAHDPDEPFRSGVTINLNADMPEQVNAVSAGEAEPSRQLFEATVRAVLVHALCNNLVISTDPDSHFTGSIGRTAADWLSLCFPELGLDALRKKCRDEPGQFEAQLQSRLSATLDGAAR